MHKQRCVMEDSLNNTTLQTAPQNSANGILKTHQLHFCSVRWATLILGFYETATIYLSKICKRKPWTQSDAALTSHRSRRHSLMASKHVDCISIPYRPQQTCIYKLFFSFLRFQNVNIQGLDQSFLQEGDLRIGRFSQPRAMEARRENDGFL